jgi:dienelactone hydrolase
VPLMSKKALPVQTGANVVGTTQVELLLRDKYQDAHPITAQIWYPAERVGKGNSGEQLKSWLWRIKNASWAPARYGAQISSQQASLPFVVYVPEWHSRHDDNTFTLANLASHGFVIAALDATIFDPWVDNGIDDNSCKTEHGFNASAARQDTKLAEHRVRRLAEKVSAFLNSLHSLRSDYRTGALGERMDLQRVGILGYSFGGAVAAESALKDRRIVAAANLDGPVYGAAATTGVDAPYLLMLSDSARPAIACARTTQPYPRFTPPMAAKVFDAARRQARRPKSHIIRIAGAKHQDFSDRLMLRSPGSLWLRPSQPNARIHAIISAYILSFFKTYVANEQHPLMCVRHSPYREVQFIQNPPVQIR